MRPQNVENRPTESCRMKMQFACPSCGAAGSMDASLSGKQVRCRQCKYRFAIPSPGEPEDEGYALDVPIGGAAEVSSIEPELGSTFVSRRGDESTTTAAAPRKARRPASGSSSRIARGQESDYSWRSWPFRTMIVALIVLATVALLAPRGTLIVGCLLMIFGSLMVLLGFGAGAYGAFREDVLYGLLYLLVPLYTGYYFVTRWDDLWAWFACSTAGVALVVLGTQMLRWNGMVV
jgi:hypothetical protein